MLRICCAEEFKLRILPWGAALNLCLQQHHCNVKQLDFKKPLSTQPSWLFSLCQDSLMICNQNICHLLFSCTSFVWAQRASWFSANAEPKCPCKNGENCSQNYQTLNSLLSLGILVALQETNHIFVAILHGIQLTWKQSSNIAKTPPFAKGFSALFPYMRRQCKLFLMWNHRRILGKTV